MLKPATAPPSRYNAATTPAELTDRHRELRHMLRELETCKPSNVRFAQILGTVQEMVSDFDKHSFSNVYQWTTRLTAQVHQ